MDYRKDVEQYWAYFKMMQKVSPGKMLSLGECDAIPDPDKTRDGKLPKWLWALPWWGAPSGRRPADWATFTMRHDFVTTLDEAPALGPGPIAPQVSILEPRDDGSARFSDKAPVLKASAVDRDGKVKRVTFMAGAKAIGSVDKAPYTLKWTDAPVGFWTVTAVAEDDTGLKTLSNAVRITVGMNDLARGKTVVVSSGKNAKYAVDGNYYTPWSAAKGNEAWIYVDLGEVRQIDRVNLMWGWKIHASSFTVEVAVSEPGESGSWAGVHKTAGRKYQKWKTVDRIRLSPVEARYVRISMTKRAFGQNWGGYKLVALEVPVKAD